MNIFNLSKYVYFLLNLTHKEENKQYFWYIIYFMARKVKGDAKWEISWGIYSKWFDVLIAEDFRRKGSPQSGITEET